MGDRLNQMQSHQTLHIYHSCRNSWLAMFEKQRKCMAEPQTEYPKLDELYVHICMTRASVHHLPSKHTNIIGQIEPSVSSIIMEFCGDTKHKHLGSYNLTVTCVIDTMYVLRSISILATNVTFCAISYRNALNEIFMPLLLPWLMMSSSFLIYGFGASNKYYTAFYGLFVTIIGLICSVLKCLMRCAQLIDDATVLLFERNGNQAFYFNDELFSVAIIIFLYCALLFIGKNIGCYKEYYKEYVMVNQFQSTLHSICIVHKLTMYM